MLRKNKILDIVLVTIPNLKPVHLAWEFSDPYKMEFIERVKNHTLKPQ